MAHHGPTTLGVPLFDGVKKGVPGWSAQLVPEGGDHARQLSVPMFDAAQRGRLAGMMEGLEVVAKGDEQMPLRRPAQAGTEDPG